MADSIRAFSDLKYDYYRLTKDFGLLKAGTIFYHDKNDTVYGSIAEGCLKNCWTPDGNCGAICGGTVILHFSYAETDWFEKIDMTPNNLAGALNPGHYDVLVNADGTWRITKYGTM